MIDSRLQQVLNMVKPNVAIPVIIMVNGALSPTQLQDVANLGLMGVRKGTLGPMIFGNGNSQTIQRIATLPFVATVHYDEPVYAHVYPTAKLTFEKEVRMPLYESVKMTGAPDLWKQGITGKGVRVAVIDTGVSKDHEMLHSVLKGTYSAVPDSSVEDEQSHGSWCCAAAAGQLKETPNGLLQGAAPGASLYALKALADDGKGQMSWVIDCVEKAVHDFKCDIISLSLGSMFDNGGVDPISYVINTIVKEHNVIPVIAAGNSFVPMSIGSPGGAAGALTVGSVSIKTPQANTPSLFSSKGPTTGLIMKPDISAPGGNIVMPKYVESIISAAKHGAYVAMAGTSMATPQVAGCMALLREAKANLSRAEVEQLIAGAAFPSPKNAINGYGLINVPKMYNLMTSGKMLPPVDRMQVALADFQSALHAPLAILPRPQSEELRAVRLN